MTEMRILTVRQPWAWAIMQGWKNVENRSQNIAGRYRGPVAIHAALQQDRAPEGHVLYTAQDGWLAWAENPVGLPWRENLGSIICVVDLVATHHADSCPTHAAGAAGPMCSWWAEPGDLYHLELANPRRLSEPIPYRGALGLRRLDSETIARVLAQIS
jgi:hypothetical protein